MGEMLFLCVTFLGGAEGYFLHPVLRFFIGKVPSDRQCLSCGNPAVFVCHVPHKGHILSTGKDTRLCLGHFLFGRMGIGADDGVVLDLGSLYGADGVVVGFYFPVVFPDFHIEGVEDLPVGLIPDLLGGISVFWPGGGHGGYAKLLENGVIIGIVRRQGTHEGGIHRVFPFRQFFFRRCCDDAIGRFFQRFLRGNAFIMVSPVAAGKAAELAFREGLSLFRMAVLVDADEFGICHVACPYTLR